MSKNKIARRYAIRKKDSGYMLLVLMLAVAVLTISMLEVARNYRRSLIRDREVEMMHRGDQYARAVKRFYHKNGRYPISIEQLENMNNIRYLRKRYKDPMSPDGAWKLVHATDIKLKPGGGITSANPSTGLGSSSAQASNSGMFSGGTFGGGNQNANSATGGTANSDAGGTTGGTAAPGSDTAESSTADTAGSTTAGSSNSSGNVTGNAAGGQVLGGGDVWGVVSKQKAEGIHAFGDKKKYNEWFFIYDPSQDKNQLLVGPYNPNTFVGSANSGLGNSNKGSSGSNGNNTSSSFGSSSGTGSSTSGSGTSGSGTSGSSSNPI